METPEGALRFRQKRTGMVKPGPMVFCVLSVLLLGGGCVGARDSGSTVTGRMLRFPLGNGVPFMRVLLDGSEGDRLQVTDSTGGFTMYHVPTGAYKITWAGFGVSVYSQDLVVEQNDQVYVVDVPAMQPGTATLSGSISDVNGKVQGAEMWLVYRGLGMANVTTADTGGYSFDNLPDGETTIIVKATGHITKVLDEVRIGFEGVRNLDVELSLMPQIEPGTITGIVRDEQGQPLGEAYVGAFPADMVPSLFMPATIETLSNFEGYQLEVEPGTYTLVCTKSGYALTTEVVVVEPGAQRTVDFTLTSEETIWRQSDIQGTLIPLYGP
jgi:hypothetical protein